MRPAPPRVAYFPDSFYEINGVAHTSRNFQAFAVRHRLPFFCLHPAARGSAISYQTEGELSTLEIPRGSAVAFRLEKDLSFDPAFLYQKELIESHLRAWRPQLIHITGPSEAGILGLWLSRTLNVPLVASWHTNLHEYAAQRSTWLQRILPKNKVPVAEKRIEEIALWACARFYQTAELLFAPNADLCRLLEGATGKHCALMPRGVESDLFSPAHRERGPGDDVFVLGFCGRLSIEKNVFLLARIREQLLERGIMSFRFLIVGHGKEESWLREHLPNAEFTGVLRGQDLSRAYANMDLFVFPSHTDTFGNVVLEALASGVPSIVTPDGGPRYIVRDGETGYIRDDEDFAGAIAGLILDTDLHQQMRIAARAYAYSASWDSVFEGVYRNYDTLLTGGAAYRETAVTAEP